MVVMFGGEFVGFTTGIKPQFLFQFRVMFALYVIFGIETAEYPAFAFGDGQADNHGDTSRTAAMFISRLLQSLTTLGLIILITDEKDGLCVFLAFHDEILG